MWIPTGDKPHVRVAFQDKDNCVQQINHDANDGFTFEVAAKSPPTLSGTSLAFINQGPKKENQYFRGYYQYENTSTLLLLSLFPSCSQASKRTSCLLHILRQAKLTLSKVMELVNEPARPGYLPYQGSFTQSVTGKAKIGATYPSVTLSMDFPRAKGPVIVYWSKPDGTLSKRMLLNDQWTGENVLPSNVNVSGGGGFLPLSYCPQGALGPVKERIYWVAQGKLWMKDL